MIVFNIPESFLERTYKIKISLRNTLHNFNVYLKMDRVFT